VSRAILQALAVTAELTGTNFSDVAARMMLEDLAPYPEQQVLASLNRCRKELKGRLTLSDILSRIDDGRPGPEEAWSMIPRDESASVVWTEEMAAAFGVALPLLNEGDAVAARMAFTERYRKLCQKARDESAPPKWTPSYGTDQLGREAAITEAMRHNRLSYQQAVTLLPSIKDREAPGEPLLLDQIKRRAIEYTPA